MPHIYVDPVVMAHLRERTALGDTYNSTIRKHLGLPAAPNLAQTAATPPESLRPLIMTARPGALLPLIATGRLATGETLTWHRPGCGQTHIVTVDGAGRLVTADGAVFFTPDSCATALAGYPCKGWPYWQTATGATLQQLREQEAVPLQQEVPRMSNIDDVLRRQQRSSIRSAGRSCMCCPPPTTPTPRPRSPTPVGLTAAARNCSSPGFRPRSPTACSSASRSPATAATGSTCSRWYGPTRRAGCPG